MEKIHIIWQIRVGSGIVLSVSLQSSSRPRAHVEIVEGQVFWTTHANLHKTKTTLKISGLDRDGMVLIALMSDDDELTMRFGQERASHPCQPIQSGDHA